MNTVLYAMMVIIVIVGIWGVSYGEDKTVTKQAREELAVERRKAQVEEAKKLIKELDGLNERSMKIRDRLQELNNDAEPLASSRSSGSITFGSATGSTCYAFSLNQSVPC